MREDCAAGEQDGESEDGERFHFVSPYELQCHGHLHISSSFGRHSGLAENTSTFFFACLVPAPIVHGAPFGPTGLASRHSVSLNSLSSSTSFRYAAIWWYRVTTFGVGSMTQLVSMKRRAIVIRFMSELASMGARWGSHLIVHNPK